VPTPTRRPVAARLQPAAAPDNGNSVNRAFQELRELIVKGHLSPGSWIVEADVAERLGLSRTPIRGALHWLHREGYVVEHKGVRKTRILVAPLTQEDARELYTIVGHLEALAGTHAAALPASIRAKLAEELGALNSQLNDIASRRPVDPRRVFDIDKEFHTTLVNAAAGPRLVALHRSVTPQVERYWRLYASSIINDLHLSVSEHGEIVRAVRKGDVAAIRDALDHNWMGGLARISRLIDLFGERGSW
jgi:DNA-binding GntR family transcriptional regulator